MGDEGIELESLEDILEEGTAESPPSVSDWESPASAAQSAPPFPAVIIYNPSKHACQSVLADIRAVWGNSVRVIQTVEEGIQRLPGMDSCISVRPKSWTDMEHFAERLNAFCARDHALHRQRVAGKVCFMPG